MGEFEMPTKPEDRRERVVGLIIAAIAVVLAIVSSVGHGTHNDEILAHVDAADQYAYYQAKRERQAQLQLATDASNLNYDRLSPAAQALSNRQLAGYEAETKRLTGEEKEIQAKGDELMAESKHLEHRAGILDLAEIALQISIVLCSITILTEQRLFLHFGVGTALVGILVALAALLAR